LLRLLLADGAENRGRELQRPYARLVLSWLFTRREDFLRCGPGRAMNGPALPPGPHFFRYKREERRKQPKHRRQRRHEGAVRRRGKLRTLIAVATAFDEFEVVVAEGPEERLRPFEHTRVVVPVEVCRRLPPQPSERRE